MKDNKKKVNMRSIVLIALCVCEIIGLLGVVLFIFKDRDDSKQNFDFVIGGLNEDGSYCNTVDRIVSEDLIACMGLKIKLAYGNDISYRIFFYDKDKRFLESTEILNGDFENRPELAKYCRIEIDPLVDVLIKKNEIKRYADQLLISVDSVQKFVLIDYFEVGNKTMGNKVYDNNGVLGSKYAGNEEGRLIINCLETKAFNFVFSKDNPSVETTYFFVDENKNIVSSGVVSIGLTEMSVTVPEGACYLYINFETGNEFVINKSN